MAINGDGFPHRAMRMKLRAHVAAGAMPHQVSYLDEIERAVFLYSEGNWLTFVEIDGWEVPAAVVVRCLGLEAFAEERSVCCFN